jgi:hypothetical protein
MAVEGTLPVQTITRAGVVRTLTSAAGGGDTFLVDKDATMLYVFNGGGGSITVTIATPGTLSGFAIGDVAVTLTAGTERFIGPLPSAYFADPATGHASVTYSGVASVTVAALKLQRD